MDAFFVTITGTNNYYGLKPFKVGNVVKLEKDTGNSYDSEAISVKMPFVGTVGYVANSVNTTFAGTYSAGRLYDKIGNVAYAKIMFITHSSVIAFVLPPQVNDDLSGMFNDEKDELVKEVII